MDKLMECAAAYQKLLDVTYKIVLGRKGKLTELLIGFEPIYFHHLIRLHKLRDLRIARANRERVFVDVLNRFSLIEADYLLLTPHDGNDIYVFITENEATGLYFCRSFFPKERQDYTKGQAVYTMLYKEKAYRSNGKIEVQYDRLISPK